MKVLLALLLIAPPHRRRALEPQLFNGKDMTAGWEHVGPQSRFTIEDGMLKTEGGMGLLVYTPQQFANTTIRVVFKTSVEHPTIRASTSPCLAESARPLVRHVHNGARSADRRGAGDDWHCTGAIYSLSKVSKRTQKPAGEWNIMDITLKGQETIVYSQRREDQRLRLQPAGASAARNGMSLSGWPSPRLRIHQPPESRWQDGGYSSWKLP